MNSFYLSEMAISDKHGGGLTLQSILRHDLRRFDAFLHVSHFAQDLPAKDSLRARCIEMPLWSESRVFRRIFRPTESIFGGKFEMLRRVHASFVAWRCE